MPKTKKKNAASKHRIIVLDKRAGREYNIGMGFGGYLATVIITAVVCTAVTVITVYQTVRLILRQIKLYHSINLVELKTSKIMYVVFIGVIGFLLICTILQMAEGESKTVQAFSAWFGVGRTLTNIALMFALIATFAVELFLTVLAVARNAVVDKGVYTNFGMLDWHQVRDYIIDEDRGVLILSSDKETFSTLKNLTTPFRVARGDIEKIKFILNKNKNKFSGFESDKVITND